MLQNLTARQWANLGYGKNPSLYNILAELVYENQELLTHVTPYSRDRILYVQLYVQFYVQLYVHRVLTAQHFVDCYTQPFSSASLLLQLYCLLHSFYIVRFITIFRQFGKIMLYPLHMVSKQHLANR